MRYQKQETRRQRIRRLKEENDELQDQLDCLHQMYLDKTRYTKALKADYSGLLGKNKELYAELEYLRAVIEGDDCFDREEDEAHEG